MSVDIGGYYVVVRKGAKIWQNAEQMARVTGWSLGRALYSRLRSNYREAHHQKCAW